MISSAKQCYFCNNNFKTIDYKETELLKRFLSPHARIMSRRKTSTCAKHQRKLDSAIKRARHLSLLPFISR
ncbi:MAG: 30S ribosomal protein S18 [Candidatus Paceibacterota bacterium]|jgi:small subunit ribosomal protein S18